MYHSPCSLLRSLSSLLTIPVFSSFLCSRHTTTFHQVLHCRYWRLNTRSFVTTCPLPLQFSVSFPLFFIPDLYTTQTPRDKNAQLSFSFTKLCLLFSREGSVNFPKLKPEDPMHKFAQQKPDPRVNFALCYGTRSSHVLSVFVPHNIGDKLDDVTAEYLREHVMLDLPKKQVRKEPSFSLAPSFYLSDGTLSIIHSYFLLFSPIHMNYSLSRCLPLYSS